jgi:predicted membrane-bound dolichyl-phosphate-mannose-protein mannosyltransferase
VGIGINAYGMALLYDPIMWETPAPIIWTVMPVIGIAGLLSGRILSK